VNNTIKSIAHSIEAWRKLPAGIKEVNKHSLTNIAHSIEVWKKIPAGIKEVNHTPLTKHCTLH